MEEARKVPNPLPPSPPHSIELEMRTSYLDYAMSVIVGRALPDVRDGLKPVHRRALFTMYDLKNNWNGPYKKSARIVGDCIGKYHPHGDQAVYDTIVRMAQDFAMRYMLVDGQGNFGSVDGDPPAAMRYTEVRMSKLTHELLADIEKETVDFGPNYDDSLHEPLVMPTRVPNLLVNGSTGIAVGMATNIPPHNLSEVIEGCIAVMRRPEITVAELFDVERGPIRGPDFPTGGTIYGAGGIRDGYETGRGIIHIRAVTEVEPMGNDRERIVVHELPYQVNKARLLEKIAELVRDKKIEGISDLRDESDRHGMRMVIELRRDAQADIVLNQLFKLTQLQQSFGINMLAIVQGEPRTLTLKDALRHFIDHRRDVVIRRTRFELREAEARAHILEGLKIALDNLDAVIALIRGSADADEARSGLMSTFGLSERQAKAILEMRLQRLTGLERDKILAELAEVMAEITRLREILENEHVLLDLIEKELRDVQAQFQDGRKTKIVASTADLDLEDLIPVEDMVVTITHEGYVKRVPVAEYRTQRRGGRGKSGMATKDADWVEHLFTARTHDHVMFFTSAGRVFSTKVYEIPSGSRLGRGKPVVNMLPLESGEKLASVFSISEFKEGHFLFFATAQGQVKKTDVMAYSNIRSSGIIAINLREGDRLIAVSQTNGSSNVLLATQGGMSIRFEEEDVRPLGRDTSGVRGIDLEPDDEVIGCITFDLNTIDEKTACLLTVTGTGYGKRTVLEEYRKQGRGGKGTIDIKAGGRNGAVVGIMLVEGEGDQYLLVTDGGIILRARAGDVRLVGRNTLGVRMIALDDGEKVVSVARYVEEDAAVSAEADDAEGADAEGADDAEGAEDAESGDETGDAGDE